MHLCSLIVGAIGLVPLATAAPSSAPLGTRADCNFDKGANHACWQGTYNLNTNYYTDTPPSGGISEHWFNLSGLVLAPDGVSRPVLAINGSIPGPTIVANWGDTIIVHVTNNLEDQGTSMHFHGLRQKDTNDQDGVASVTQCPITPGSTKTYTFVAHQYGTSWYHSHYGVQAWDGVFGAIQINGPVSAPYDIDLGPLLLSGWTHRTSESIFEDSLKAFDPVTNPSGPTDPDYVDTNNGLINGTNVYNGAGSRFQLNFTEGSSHRLRLINTAINNHFVVSIDNHTMQVIGADFVSIEPFTTDLLYIGIGQRYDVIITANQTAGEYWFRADTQGNCGMVEAISDKNIKAVVRYNSSASKPGAEPLTDDNRKIIPTTECLDMSTLVKISPSMKLDVPTDVGTKTINESVSWTQAFDPTTSIITWQIKQTPYISEWGNPTLKQIVDPNAVFDPKQHIVELTGKDVWVHMLIETDAGTPHPIHLHGHDFLILSQGANPYDNATDVLNLVNPPRRDVAMLPGGHLYIAFLTDNPGAWLLHCHIGWHASQGFAMTLLERRDEIKADQTVIAAECAAWNTFAQGHNVTQHDSGI
ncbi:multicopper oxidase [Podospora appendiculata]|uniref:Multicopper oxidase n=1 Tax=Podospora appendiculata TaxID=314037 RepID=A0AAE1CG33_9PEZI|nr:multicopper oxidase [Podospora appendiculata]